MFVLGAASQYCSGEAVSSKSHQAKRLRYQRYSAHHEKCSLNLELDVLHLFEDRNYGRWAFSGAHGDFLLAPDHLPVSIRRLLGV